MKEVVLQRVKNFLTEKGISKFAFARSLKMEQTTVNNQLLGKRSVSIDLILSLLNNYPDVSAEWLLRGAGEMYISDKSIPYAENLSEANCEYESMREMHDRIVALEAENNVLREMVGLQKRTTKGKSA